MNVSEMVSNVNAVVHPATNMNTFIKRQLNRAQKVFVSRAQAKRAHKFSWMKLSNVSLATVASQEAYALSPLIKLGKTILFRNPSGNRTITVLDRTQFNEMVPNPTSNGEPDYAYFVEFWPVQYQPTSASTLSLVSSTTDTAVIRIEGLNASGVLVGEEVTLNGATPVSTTNSYSKILERSDNGFRNGTLTITSNSGGVTNAVIGPRQRQLKFPVFNFYPIPSGTGPIYYDAEIALVDLVNDNDMSRIPEDYHDALEDYAAAKLALTKGDKTLAATLMEGFDQRVFDAVDDDSGPERIIQIQDYAPTGSLGKGTLPGLFPRDY